MAQNYLLYYEALDTNKQAFAHGLFTQAYQSLSTALHYSFDIKSPRRISTVERLAKEQLDKLEKHFAPALSPLEPEEVSNYRTLVKESAVYRALVESALRGNASVVTTSTIAGHTFEDITTIDDHSGIPVSYYAIDGVPVEPATWDTKYAKAQDHKNALASGYKPPPRTPAAEMDEEHSSQ